MSLLISSHIRFVPDFVREHRELFTWLHDNLAWDSRIRARKTASLGVPYNYSGLTYEPVPFPEHLSHVLSSLEQLLGYASNNCLANFYPDGSSTMGFHADEIDNLTPGTGIAIVSLGAERTLSFRKQSEKLHLEHQRLPSGSLLWMSPEMQAEWRHAVLAEENVGPRISLTFRAVKTSL